MSPDAADKVRENRVRRAAERQGLQLEKSRRRDPRAIDYGRYWLRQDDEIVYGDSRTGATLDEVEQYLTRDPHPDHN
ncbi:hypothetical protein EV645_3977 [Kribbella rubisoli]|uniref:Uncharacterized protein n=1 Tax=Kribbella rubisoli TaxID=3075929 RepID=A0A4Q7X0K9_9ACTN|nr:hypothetical protein [Kribbella rubisoli]RZU16412.1 hypothetical protein EV645_3977 [Kribbella rubisoli]